MTVLDIQRSALWRDAGQLPQTLCDSLARAEGHDDLARAMSHPAVRRIVVSGNGASLYAGTALWLAALQARLPIPVVTVPAGLLAQAAFRWQEGDYFLAVSSSGSLRDLLEAVDDPALPRPFGLITARAESPLGRSAGVCALVTVTDQRAVTHTQAYLGGVVVALDIIGRAAGDGGLRNALGALPDIIAGQLEAAPEWAADAVATLDGSPPRAAVAFGTGAAWVAAQEAALLLKEVAGIPAEGTETREGATTGMYALDGGHVVLALPVRADPLAEEAASVCARRGARVLVAPWEEAAEPSCAAAVHFLYPLALAIRLALEQGRDPDEPGWYAAYESTARRPLAPVSSAQTERDLR